MKISRKKTFAIFALIALSALCLALSLSACDQDSRTTFDAAAPIYDLNIVYTEEPCTLSVKQEVLFETPLDMAEDYIAFRLYANAFTENNDAIDILSVKINRQTASYEICGDKNTILKVPCASKGELVSAAFEYNVNVPHAEARLGKTERCASLCHFYPSLAMYEDGWREDGFACVGDPFYGACADFYATIYADTSLQVASSGNVSERDVTMLNGKPYRVVDVTAEHIRDFGMAIGDFATAERKTTLESGDVMLKYCYLEDDDPEDTMKAAETALRAFSDAFGDYPYASFTLAQVALDGAGGMEYGAFATVSPAPRATYREAVTHEIAHQWWYSAVGNDQLNSAWQDEGLSEFCTYFICLLQGDRAGYSAAIRNIAANYADHLSVLRPVGFDATMQRHLDTFASGGEYVAVTYMKGTLMFDHLLSLAGEKRFLGAMKTYFEQNKFRIATPASLKAAFDSQGLDISPVLDSWLYSSDK